MIYCDKCSYNFIPIKQKKRAAKNSLLFMVYNTFTFLLHFRTIDHIEFFGFNPVMG